MIDSENSTYLAADGMIFSCTRKINTQRAHINDTKERYEFLVNKL